MRLTIFWERMRAHFGETFLIRATASSRFASEFA